MIGGAADQNRVGAQRGEGGRDRVALLAGGAIGDIAHGVDRLVRRARGDEGAFARKRRIRT